MAAIQTWAQLAAGNDQAVPDGAPERHDRDQVNDITRTNMGALRTFFEDGEWLDLTLENGAAFTVSRAGIDRFLVVDGTGTDARSKFPVGRWVKVTGTVSPTLAYGEVASVPTYSAPNTTVILKNIVDASYVTDDIPDTTVTKVECYWSSRVRQAAFHPVGTTVGEVPKELLAVDDISAAPTIAQLNTATGLDADLLGGVAAAGYELAGGSSRNAIVNSSMNVWQRDVSFTTPADALYNADRMVLLAENALWDVDREDTNLPSGYRHALRMTANGTAVDKAGILHIITGANSRQIIDDGTASFSYYVRTVVGVRIRAAILEWRTPGVEDVPDRDWVNVWGAELTDPAPVANWLVANTPSADQHVGDDSWTLVTVENVTINATTKNLAVFIWLEDKSFTNGDIIRMTGLQLNPGATARTHVPGRFDLDVLESIPHYRTSYDPGVSIQTVTDVGQLEFSGTRHDGIPANGAVENVRLPLPMFKTPTVLTFSPGLGSPGQATDPSGDVPCSVIAGSNGRNGFVLQVTGDPDNDQPCRVHFTAEAEL